MNEKEKTENAAGQASKSSINEFSERMEELRKKSQEANEAMGAGKGKLRLETTFQSGGKTVEELKFDFTALTGVEYTDAMDSDPNAGGFRLTNRQALALFAKAAAKQTEGPDAKDIMENIGVTDAVEGVQLATLFFNASARAGRMRISKL